MFSFKIYSISIYHLFILCSNKSGERRPKNEANRVNSLAGVKMQTRIPSTTLNLTANESKTTGPCPAQSPKTHRLSSRRPRKNKKKTRAQVHNDFQLPARLVRHAHERCYPPFEFSPLHGWPLHYSVSENCVRDASAGCGDDCPRPN